MESLRFRQAETPVRALWLGPSDTEIQS